MRRRLEEREQLHGEKETLRIIRFISLSCQNETNLDIMFLRLSKRKDKHESRVMQGKKKTNETIFTSELVEKKRKTDSIRQIDNTKLLEESRAIRMRKKDKQKSKIQSNFIKCLVIIGIGFNVIEI